MVASGTIDYSMAVNTEALLFGNCPTGHEMATLQFYYSSMNAGKSTALLQSSYNYQERGMQTLVLTPKLDTRYGSGKVTSRIGIQAEAHAFNTEDDLLHQVRIQHEETRLHCVQIDEAQFLTKKQVYELGEVCDRLDIPVMAYGLRTDFRGEPFEGSLYLLAWADELIEIRTVCRCGAKATMVIRYDEDGFAVSGGSQIQIGGNDRYIPLCRKHFKSSLASREPVV